LRRALPGTLALSSLSFIGETAVEAVATALLTPLGWWLAVLLGIIIAGNSPTVIVPLSKGLGMGDRTRDILFLESALGDVVSIVVALALLDFHQWLGTLAADQQPFPGRVRSGDPDRRDRRSGVGHAAAQDARAGESHVHHARVCVSHLWRRGADGGQWRDSGAGLRHRVGQCGTFAAGAGIFAGGGAEPGRDGVPGRDHLSFEDVLLRLHWAFGAVFGAGVAVVRRSADGAAAASTHSGGALDAAPPRAAAGCQPRRLHGGQRVGGGGAGGVAGAAGGAPRGGTAEHYLRHDLLRRGHHLSLGIRLQPAVRSH